MIGAPLATIEFGIMPGTIGLSVIDSSKVRARFAAAVAVAGFALVGMSGTARASELELSGAVTVAGPTAPGVVAAGGTAPAGEENCLRATRRGERMVTRPEMLFQRRPLMSLPWNRRGRGRLRGKYRGPAPPRCVWSWRKDETSEVPGSSWSCPGRCHGR